MNKSELVESISKKTGLSLKHSQLALKGFLDAVNDELADGGEVALIGFGKFYVRDRPARTARNPRDGKPVQIPASKAPVFTAGKPFKDAVNGK